MLLGWAADGFPIYGPLDYDSEIILDECNFDKQNLRYHTKRVYEVEADLPYCPLKETSIGEIQFFTNWNYILGCYRGDTSKAVITKGWGMGGSSIDRLKSEIYVKPYLDCEEIDFKTVKGYYKRGE